MNPLGSKIGGDKYLVQSQYVPLDQVGKLPPKPPTPGDTEQKGRFPQPRTTPRVPHPLEWDRSMIGRPGVVDALNVLLASEITLHEAGHGWEKVFECHKYKKLRKWFDSEIEGSRERRRYLEKRIVRLGGTLKITMSPATVDPAGSIAEIVSDSTTFFLSMLEAYRAGWDAVYKAGDSTTADDLCQLQKTVEHAIFQLEAFAVQIADIGIGPWTQSQL